jgi:hypothetical protein
VPDGVIATVGSA